MMIFGGVAMAFERITLDHAKMGGLPYIRACGSRCAARTSCTSPPPLRARPATTAVAITRPLSIRARPVII